MLVALGSPVALHPFSFVGLWPVGLLGSCVLWPSVLVALGALVALHRFGFVAFGPLGQNNFQSWSQVVV